MDRSNVTLAGIIRAHGAEQPDRIAIVDGNVRLSYGELDRRSNRVANALLASGVQAGDRVAVLDKNGHEQYEVMFGAAKIGAIFEPISHRLAPAEVAAILADSTPAVVAVGEDLLPLVADHRGTRVVVLGAHHREDSYERWCDPQPNTDPGHHAAQSDTAFLLYSSGTTGMPKGIETSNANITSSFTEYHTMMGFRPTSVVLAALPFFHIGGLGWALCGLIEGATLVSVRDIVPGPLGELLERERVTHAGLVPAVLQFLLQVPGIHERDFTALEGMMYGASPISEPVLRGSLELLGCRFYQAYGLSETSGTTVLLEPEEHHLEGPLQHRLRSAGKPRSRHFVRVVDPTTGVDVPTGEVGEILLKGPNVMKGYWNQPELTAKVIVDGWFHTGDAGYLDADGFLYLHDRIKDMIVSGGENIYSVEVEQAVASCPGVIDCAVVAVPSERWGETPKAFVVRGPGHESLAADEVIAHCRSVLAPFKCPTSVEFVDLLPRNASGKVLKKELRAPFWEGHNRSFG